MAEQIKNREDQMLIQAIEFLRQAHAKKQSAQFWGDVTVVLRFEAGQIIDCELTDGVTLRKSKKPQV